MGFERVSGDVIYYSAVCLFITFLVPLDNYKRTLVGDIYLTFAIMLWPLIFAGYIICTLCREE